MKPLSIELVTAHMEDDDWSSLHDSVYCALYNTGLAPAGKLSNDILAEVLRRIPQHVWAAALSWGFSDTVAGDNIVEFLLPRFKALGSFEAFLQSPLEQP